jgi:TonB family protein
VIASPRAGGALNLYGVLRGDRVYTIYISTRLGTAVMQFADPASAEHAVAGELTAPRAIRVDLPSELPQEPRSQVLIRCEVDPGGSVRNARILRADDNDFADKLLTGVRFWKFTPAVRGNEPVAVDAILGFGVGTK